MKRLDKLKMKENAEILNDQEMKLLLGGRSGCGYATSIHTNTLTCIVYGGATEAEFMAGSYGWWCCNCSYASGC
jgi:natural product precursor